MNLEIRKIRLNELESFVESKTFGQFSTIPITPGRAKSYRNNPNALPGDVVLYMGFIDNKLIAFRTIFAGIVNTAKDKIRFGWCSGNWVHSNFRREGFSEQLLKAAYTDWDKRLMFTNYAPNSEKLYLKTGWFQPIHQFEGVRGYLFPKTLKLIAKSNSNRIVKFIFSTIDLFIAQVSAFRILFYSEKNKNNIRFKTFNFPDETCYKFIKNSKPQHVFNRGQQELEWIFQYPWISGSNKTFVAKYPFSSYFNSFGYKTVKIFTNGEMAGFFLFSVREGHLKTLYFNIHEGIEKDIVHFIKQYCVDNKIEFVTICNPVIAEHFITQKFPFLYTKKYGQRIYSSFEIDTENYQFQDGDGDTMFT